MENLQGEIWKDIKGYEGCYQISNYGRVLSLYSNGAPRGVTTRIKKLQMNNCGYWSVTLQSKEHKAKRHLIHRLIAIAFIPNPLFKSTVNHIDGNKQNNAIENLEWMTYSENVLHANAIGLRVDQGKGRKLSVEHRAKMSASMKGRKSPCGNKGKTRSAEAIQKFKETLKRKRDEKVK